MLLLVLFSGRDNGQGHEGEIGLWYLDDSGVPSAWWFRLATIWPAVLSACRGGQHTPTSHNDSPVWGAYSVRIVTTLPSNVRWRNSSIRRLVEDQPLASPCHSWNEAHATSDGTVSGIVKFQRGQGEERYASLCLSFVHQWEDGDRPQFHYIDLDKAAQADMLPTSLEWSSIFLTTTCTRVACVHWRIWVLWVWCIEHPFHWFQITWPPGWVDVNISVNELLSIVVTAAIWGRAGGCHGYVFTQTIWR